MHAAVRAHLFRPRVSVHQVSCQYLPPNSVLKLRNSGMRALHEAADFGANLKSVCAAMIAYDTSVQ
jgi:hypothetical protein